MTPDDAFAVRSRALFAALPPIERVAAATGISRVRLRRLARGEDVPSTEELLALRLHFEVSGTWWVGGDESAMFEPLPHGPLRRPRRVEPEARPLAQLDYALHRRIEEALLLVDELARKQPDAARQLAAAVQARVAEVCGAPAPQRRRARASPVAPKDANLLRESGHGPKA